jgi:hypothetical protein
MVRYHAIWFDFNDIRHASNGEIFCLFAYGFYSAERLSDPRYWSCNKGTYDSPDYLPTKREYGRLFFQETENESFSHRLSLHCNRNPHSSMPVNWLRSNSELQPDKNLFLKRG